jgi:hypothetical protein
VTKLVTLLKFLGRQRTSQKLVGIMRGSSRRLVTWISVIAGLIAIFGFLTGIQQVPWGCSAPHSSLTPAQLAPETLLGTWQCVDPDTQKLLKTVTFNADSTYEEWRGGQIIRGNYKYNKQTGELSFVYVQKNRGGREDPMELGRVTRINETAFQFKVLSGYMPTLPPRSIYEFRR